jgi:hypothetical protein
METSEVIAVLDVLEAAGIRVGLTGDLGVPADDVDRAIEPTVSCR